MESDDRIFGSLPSIDEGAIGGVWNAEWDVPRPYGHRSNHASWHGMFFPSKGSYLSDLVDGAASIGDVFGEPTAPGRDDNVVLPGHAPNCKCQLRLIYDLKDVPRRNLTGLGRRALREGWV